MWKPWIGTTSPESSKPAVVALLALSTTELRLAALAKVNWTTVLFAVHLLRKPAALNCNAVVEPLRLQPDLKGVDVLRIERSDVRRDGHRAVEAAVVLKPRACSSRAGP